MKFRLLMIAICVLATANIVSAAPFAYIVNSTTKNVSVIDTANNTVTASVPLSNGYPWGVTVGASGQYVYVGIQNPNAINIIDTATNTATQIPLGSVSPGGLALNAAETRLYVTNYASNTLHVIDLPTMTPIGSVAVATETVSNPAGIVLSSYGNKAYVANSSTGTVAEISIDEEYNLYERTALTPVASSPIGLALSSDGSKLYVSSALSSVASVINTATMGVVTTLNVGSGTTNIAVTATKAYAPSTMGDLYVIDAVADPNVVLGTPITVAPGLFGSSVTPDGSKLYLTVDATNDANDSVKVINFLDSNSITTIPFPVSNPTGMGNFMGQLFDHAINATNGPDCIIYPSGSIPVNSYGRKFMITSGTGATCEVKVDGLPVGQPSAYAFTDVTINHTIDASKLLTGTYYQLSAEWISNVGGYLVSNASGISNVSTKAQFLSGSSVIISPDSNHAILPGSWTGDCVGQGATCTIIMNGERNLTAVVINKTTGTGPIYCVTKTTYYQTFTEMVAAAATGDIMKIASSLTAGGTTNGTAVNIILSSGWNPEHTTPSSSTMGPLIIGTTAVIVDPTVGYTLTI